MKRLMLKFIPKFLRKMIANAVVDELSERISKKSLVGYTIDGVSWLIEKGTSDVTDDRMTAICNGCELGGETLRIVSLSCKPESDGGRKITESEKDEISKNFALAVDMLVSDELVDRVVDIARDKVYAYLGVEK